ncbi:MAG TPA: DUF2953 domain-containing protein [Dehalococcoidales bacterium]|nr:DUF2953 domain-containing protein [Dehalococcoidales bacterium]
MAAWFWVIIGIGSFILVLIAILCIPLYMELVLDTAAKRHLQIRLIGLFSLIKVKINTNRRKDQRHQKRRRRISIWAVWQILTIKGLVPNLCRLLRSVFQQIHVKEITFKLKIGFEDPADGGMLFALAGIMNPFFRIPKNCKLEIQPSMSDRDSIHCYFYGIMRIQPIKLFLPICRFVFSTPILRAMKVWRLDAY